MKVNKSRKFRGGYVARMEDGRSIFKILTGLGVDGSNIRMDIKEICVNMRNLIDSELDRDYWLALVNAALNLRLHKPSS